MNKITLSVISLLFTAPAFAQTPAKQFTLKGKLSGTPIDSVIVYYSDAAGKYVHVANAVVNDEFTMSGLIAHPVNSSLLFKNKGEVIAPRNQMAHSRQVYLEPGIVTVTGDPAKLAELKVTGSKTQADMDALTAVIAPIRKEEEPIIAELEKEKDHEKASAIRDKLDPFQERIKKVTYAFFLKHPDSYVTADQIRYYSNMKLDSTERIYNNFNAEMKESDRGKELLAEINRVRAGSPGSIAPLFSRADIDGKSLALADFKGKYVMLDFWASWCVPCRQGNPHMISLYNKYKGKGFEIIGIADDDTRQDAWKGAVAKDEVGIWHHVLRGLDMVMIRKGLINPEDLDNKYGIHSIPTKILIDPSGKIIGRFGDSIGGTDADMDKMLASVFKN